MIISEQEKTITGPHRVAEIIAAVLALEHETDQNREHFWTIGVNTRNVVQFIELVSLGSSNTAVVNPREVFRFAVMKGVAAIILCHNHPSGDSSPSIDDLLVTKRLADAGRILGIGVLDHVIIGKSLHSFSFYEQGLIESRFRGMLFRVEGTQWQYYSESIPARIRKKRSPKIEGRGDAATAAVAQL